MLRLNDISVELAGRQILAEVSLSADPGETVAILGASGSGKSTLLRAAVGLLRPDSGNVEFAGEDLLAAAPARLREIRRKAGMLFQMNALFDSMTVADNIGFILREVLDQPPAKVKDKVDDLLDRLKLGPIGDKYPAELSGGMKKRVGIARAIAHGPQIVFYDDPTAGLDPITSDVIADIIVELGQEKERAAVIASNYLPLVTKAASRVCLLHKGRLIHIGSPADIWDSDRKEVRRFLDTNGGGK